jgi:hypothetical protein
MNLLPLSFLYDDPMMLECSGYQSVRGFSSGICKVVNPENIVTFHKVGVE